MHACAERAAAGSTDVHVWQLAMCVEAFVRAQWVSGVYQRCQGSWLLSSFCLRSWQHEQL